MVATLLSVVAMLLLYAVVSQEPRVPSNATLVLSPSGDIPEVLPELLLGGRGELTVRGYVELIRKAKTDARIAGILLRPGGINSPFWAKVQELRDAIEDFKGSGKYVYAWLEYGGDREYFLASVADKVYLLPSASLDLTGVAGYEVFLRGTFDWIGTYPDFLHVGDYKTAINTYLEKTFTPAHREMSEALNRSQYDQLVDAIAGARSKAAAEVRTLIDQGPFQPAEALRVGLIDEVAYEDELDDLVPDLKGADYIDAEDYAAVSWQATGVRRSSKIAVINAAGVINSGSSGFDPVNGPVVGADSLVGYIRRRPRRSIDSRHRAPRRQPRRLLDGVRRDLARAVDFAREQPSGHRVDVGSGGVRRLLHRAWRRRDRRAAGHADRIDRRLHRQVRRRRVRSRNWARTWRRRAAASTREIYSPDRRFTPEERSKIQESMQLVYDQFIERTAAARHMTPEKVDEIAQGRVWTGAQAKEIGLVDELGGLYKAIDLAKQRARIPADEEVELVVYPPHRSFYEVLADELSSPAGRLKTAYTSDALLELLGPRERRALAAVLAPSRLFRSGQVLAHMPYVFVSLSRFKSSRSDSQTVNLSNLTPDLTGSGSADDRARACLRGS